MTTLKEEFESALALKRELDDADYLPSSPRYRDIHSRALQHFADVITKVHQLGLYSRNEVIDDIPANELQYLNTDYYVAQLLDMSYINPSQQAVAERAKVARSTIRKYIDFLFSLEERGFRVQDFYRLKEFLPSGQNGQSGLEPLVAQITRESTRQKKAEHYRQVRNAKMRYENSLELHQMQLGDDELARDAAMQELSYHSILAWEGIRNGARELDLLRRSIPSGGANIFAEDDNFGPHVEFRASLADVHRQANQIDEYEIERPSAAHNKNYEYTSNDPYSVDPRYMTLDNLRDYNESREDFSTRIELTPQTSVLNGGKVQRPFTLATREQIARGVMGTGQYLPTVSVEEFIDHELKNGGMVQAESNPAEIDEDDAKHWDSETEKARRWDEFIEANPRGSGNTMNRG